MRPEAWRLARKPVRSCYLAADVDVVMNGSLEIERNVLEFVRGVRVLTGTNHSARSWASKMTSWVHDRPLAIVQEALRTVGYDPRGIVLNYDFAVPEAGNARDRVDLAAFSDPVRHDLQTSCIAAQRVPTDAHVQVALNKLSYLAAPLALLLQTESVDIWPVTRNSTPQRIERVSYSKLGDYLAAHARDFHPETLTASKTTGRQPSFFDLDRSLFEFAYQATQQILVEKFEAAVGATKNAVGNRDDLKPGELTKAVLQILAAAILEDKLLLGDEPSSNVEDLIDRSEKLYGQYFDLTSLERIGLEVGQVTYEFLRSSVTFRSFTNDMLGYFYENALVDQDLRRELGVYYTPRSVAKRILSRLPVEDIPPSGRVVFDGSSGSGNLLLAAVERIGDLLPSGWDRTQRHSYLVQRVHGVDVDQFATQVAGLSLFFIDLPAGDTWNVNTANFMSTEPARLPRSPTIVVGNPPFRESRSSEGRREQRASLFLAKYLDLLMPGGLLGVVLPETFLENSSCRDARRRLLNECEILELWHLPEGTFPLSNAATVVVIARKREATRQSLGEPFRVERVGSLSHEKKQFLNGARPRFSYVVPSAMPWMEDPGIRFHSSPLEGSVWDAICSDKKLKDLALVRNGIIPGKDQRTDHFDTSRRGEEWKPWLSGARDFEPYVVNPRETKFVRYPGNLERPRLDLESAFESPRSKILVNSGRAPGNPWRIYAAIDDVGYFPSQSFHCVLPKDDSVSPEEFVAVLNSPVASAWVDSRNRRRWVGDDTLRELPFPVFTESQRKAVVEQVREITELKNLELHRQSSYSPSGQRIYDLALSIDKLVFEAFRIGESGLRMLNRYFAGYPRPGLGWTGDYQENGEDVSPANERKWSVTGEVLQIDANNQNMMVWVRGYHDDEPFRISIPETLPGWALRPEAGFMAEVPWSARDKTLLRADDLANFRPLEFSHTQTEELLEILRNPRKLDALYGL